MAALVSVLLVLLPFGLYLAWRRYGPSTGEPSSVIILFMLLAIGIGLGTAVWFGLSRSMEPGTVYVPAHLGADGSIEPRQVEPRPVEPRR